MTNPHQEYQQLQEQIRVLQARAALLENEARNAAIIGIGQQIAAFNLTTDDITVPRPKKKEAPRPSRAQRPALYKDPVSGATWTGQGKEPNWIAGKDRARFQIVRGNFPQAGCATG